MKPALVTAFAVACVALLYSLVFSQYSVEHYEKQLKNVEQRLHARQTKLEKKSSDLLNTVCAATDSALSDILLKTEIRCKPNEGIFCFRNDSLIYWSSSLPIQNEALLKLNDTEKFTSFADNLFVPEAETESWYVAQAQSRNEFKVVYVITVFTNYFYENDFLKSGFDENLKISSAVFLENLGGGSGLTVYGKNQTPLFVLGIDVRNNINQVSMYFRWLAIAVLLLVFVILANRFWFRNNLAKTLISIVAIFSFTMFLVYNYLGTLYSEFSFFNSSFYASSRFLPSFGILLMYVIFILTIIYVVFTKRRIIFLTIKKANKYKRFAIRCALFCAATVQSVLCVLLPITLTNDSNFSLAVHKIYAINWFTALSYILMALMFTGFAMLHILYLQSVKSSRHKIAIIATQLLVAVLLLLLCGVHRIVIVSLFIVHFALLSHVFYRIKSVLKTFIVFTAVSTIFCVSVILHEGFRKTKQITKNLAESLSQKNDPVFEVLFAEISDKLMLDGQLQAYVKDANVNIDIILNYLTENYFDGYFSTYFLDLNLCLKKDILHVAEPNKEIDYNCFDFFDNEKHIYGSQVGELPLWFMSIGNGKINYLAELSYHNDVETKLFLNFTSLSELQYTGYPELLLDQKNQPNKLLRQNDYSYAKYFKNKLVSRYGNFKYNYELNTSEEIKNYYFFINRGYIHYYIEIDEDNSIIISTPTISLLEFFSSNSFVFLFFVILLSILLYCTGFNVLELAETINFKQKIRILLLLLVLFLLIVMGGTILWHTFGQFEKNKMEAIEEKIQFIDNEFTLQYGTSDNIAESRDLSQWLIALSNLYHIDINIYSLDGKLLSTSRPEIFNKKLLGLNINRQAFMELNTQNQPYYTYSENIGKLKFNSIYLAFYNDANKKLAYITLPYFEQQHNFQGKWLAMANTIINIFIVAIILGILFATIISNLLSKPLDIVRSQIGKFSLTGKSEYIKYKGNDEIGSLVKAYNSMLDQLAESAAKLAQTEREHAWREMAQQIAHEIKNPLTPMRLSIQHILRLKKNNSPDWEKYFEISAKSLLEQIDVLSVTASEFSNFAKMANQECKDIDVVALLEKQLEIFRGYEKIKITLNVEGDKPKIVSALYEQLQRVFTNLIKNSIQAIGDDSSGEIDIFARDLPNGYYQFAIEDTGAGISEEQRSNLFRPKFTTKSSGTGLGLAISKNIIENIGGRIYYSPTQSGKTCFIVELNKVDNG